MHTTTTTTHIILASGSPRRREILGLTGLSFEIRPADVDETQHPGEEPVRYALRLAVEKARKVASGLAALPQQSFILAADTIVVDSEEVLGKPGSAAEAVQVLQRLRGRTHAVYTALALLRPADGLLLTELCRSDVPMRAYTDQEITAYVASGDPMDKAGSYAIQHPGFRPVASLNSCYANVVGLPLCHLLRLLRRLDQHPQPQGNLPGSSAQERTAQACMQRFEYACPVYRPILEGDL